MTGTDDRPDRSSSDGRPPSSTDPRTRRWAWLAITVVAALAVIATLLWWRSGTSPKWTAQVGDFDEVYVDADRGVLIGTSHNYRDGARLLALNLADGAVAWSMQAVIVDDESVSLVGEPAS